MEPKQKWNQNENRSQTEYEEEWRGTKMKDGETKKTNLQIEKQRKQTCLRKK